MEQFLALRPVHKNQHWDRQLHSRWAWYNLEILYAYYQNPPTFFRNILVSDSFCRGTDSGTWIRY